MDLEVDELPGVGGGDEVDVCVLDDAHVGLGKDAAYSVHLTYIIVYFKGFPNITTGIFLLV